MVDLNKSPLNLVQYTTMDFPSFYDALLKEVKTKYGADYNDISSTAVGEMLIHIFSFGLSQLGWLQDRRMSDNYFETAVSRNAMSRLAKRLGYKMSSAASASGDLIVTCDATPAIAVLAKNFRFQGPDGLVYLNTADQTIPAGTTSFTVSVREGDNRQLDYVSNGLQNQVYSVTGTILNENIWVSKDDLQVFVNGVLWTETPFLTLDKTDQYELGYNEDPVVVRFGDGVAGNVPITGANIVIRYILTHGDKGNVKTASITSTIDDFLVAGVSHKLTPTNSLPMTGGVQPEDIEKTRKIAPSYFAARDCAVSESDYKAIVNSFSDSTYGAVAKGQAAVIRNTYFDSITSGYIDTIEIDSESWKTSDQASCTYIQLLLDDIETSENDIQTNTDAIVVNTSVITNSIASCNSDILAIRGETAKQSMTRQVGMSQVAAMITKINALTPANVAAEKILLDTMADDVNTLFATDLGSTLGNINAYTDLLNVEMGKITDNNTGIIGYNNDIVFVKNVIEASRLSIELSVASIVSTSISNDADIDLNCSNLVTRCSELFNADCKSNIVSVPILTTDTNGFYSAPSTGLIRRLETHLNERKDVTHTVQVVSGTSWLVYAAINVTGKVLPTYVKSVIESNIAKAIDNLLKGRDFSVRLDIDTLYKSVESIIGIEYINIEITGPTDRLDAEGNLVPLKLEIITKGSVAITMI